MSNTWPELGASSPPSKFSRVVLPAPDVPIMATLSPGTTSNSAPFKMSRRAPPSLKYLHRALAVNTDEVITNPIHIAKRGKAQWRQHALLGNNYLAHSKPS